MSTLGFTFSFFDQYPNRLRQFSRWLQSFNCYAAEYKYVIFYPAFKYPELFENQLRPGTNKYEIRAKQSQGPALCFHIYGNVTSRNFSLKDSNLRCFHVHFYCTFRPFHVPLENTSIWPSDSLCANGKRVSKNNEGELKKCVHTCFCLKSMCDGNDVESDNYREFKRGRKLCWKGDKSLYKNVSVVWNTGVSHRSNKWCQYNKLKNTSKHMKLPTLHEMFQSDPKQLEPQRSTSGTCVSAALSFSPRSVRYLLRCLLIDVNYTSVPLLWRQRSIYSFYFLKFGLGMELQITEPNSPLSRNPQVPRIRDKIFHTCTTVLSIWHHVFLLRIHIKWGRVWQSRETF